jgi:CRP/FNR family cyclic AMP-dependent transcriptional regulator
VDWVLLRSLTEPEQRAVLAAAVQRRFRRGDIVFHAGDPGDAVHLIAAGRVAVRAITPDGDAVTYAVVGPGEAVGELALLSRDHRRTATIVALEQVETLALRREQFETIRTLYPSVDRMLVEILAQRVRRLSTHLVEALYVPVDKRVVRRILALCRQYGEAGTAPVSLPLTQTELAEMAGATRPTINKVLRTLVDAGAIDLARGRVQVVDREALRRIAQ